MRSIERCSREQPLRERRAAISTPPTTTHATSYGDVPDAGQRVIERAADERPAHLDAVPQRRAVADDARRTAGSWRQREERAAEQEQGHDDEALDERESLIACCG